MKTMLVSLALVTMLATPVPAESAPPPASATPVPSAALAPAPATIVVAPAPAPAPAPASAETSTTVVTPEATTVTTTSSSGSGTTSTTSVVVVSRPPPTPPPPTFAHTRPAPAIPHDPWRTDQAIRMYRRRSIALLGLAGLGMAGTLGSQWLRARDLQQCLDGPRGNPECVEADEMNSTYAGHGFMGSATFVLGASWAGALLGKAAATRDVLQRGRDARSRPGLKLLGMVALGASAAWMIGANYTLLRHESECDGHHGCIAKYRPLRWAANDGAAVGFGIGSGLLSYGMAYQRHGVTVTRVRAMPAVSSTQAGMGVSVEF